MDYPQEQIDELKRYCSKVSALTEGNATFLFLEQLRLPEGCQPSVCDALLRPFQGGDGYPSQLYFSTQIALPYAQNWNVSNARICEKTGLHFRGRSTPYRRPSRKFWWPI